MISAILSALAAIPAIAKYVDMAVSAIMLWYVQRQTNQTLQAISDAAAQASRAQTDDDRYQAALAWRDALSRNRVS